MSATHWGMRKGSLEEQVTLEPALGSQVGFCRLEEARLCPPSRLAGAATTPHTLALRGALGMSTPPP